MIWRLFGQITENRPDCEKSAPQGGEKPPFGRDSEVGRGSKPAETSPSRPGNRFPRFPRDFGVIWRLFGQITENRPDREKSAPQSGEKPPVGRDFGVARGSKPAETGPSLPGDRFPRFPRDFGVIWAKFSEKAVFRQKHGFLTPPPGPPNL